MSSGHIPIRRDGIRDVESYEVRAEKPEFNRIVGNEERWHTVGLDGGITLLLVVHTVKGEYGEEEIRIIPAGKASARERALYGSPQ
jgi:uncharacterized DUF497 family protein